MLAHRLRPWPTRPWPTRPWLTRRWIWVAVAGLLLFGCGSRSAPSQGHDAAADTQHDGPPRPGADLSTGSDQRALPPRREVIFLDGLAGVPWTSNDRFAVARVRTDSTGYATVPGLSDLISTKLALRDGPAVVDLRRQAPQQLCLSERFGHRFWLPGRGALLPFERGSEGARERGLAWIGDDGDARELFASPSGCVGCDELAGSLAIGPEGRFASVVHGSKVMLLRMDGQLFANGLPALAIDASSDYYLFPHGHALTSSALYFTTGGQQVNDLHTLWRLPLDMSRTRAQALPLVALSDQSQATWISGAEGLSAHRGPAGHDRVAFTLAHPSPHDGPVTMPAEDVAMALGSKTARFSASLASYGAAPRKLLISPSGQRIAVVRHDVTGWPEVELLELGRQPIAVGTRKAFSGSELHVDGLHFVDDQRLLVLAGSEAGKPQLYLFDSAARSLRALSYEGSPPFAPPAPWVNGVTLGSRGRIVLITIVTSSLDVLRRWVDLRGKFPPGSTTTAYTDPVVCGPDQRWLLLHDERPKTAELIALDLDAPATPLRLAVPLAYSDGDYSVARLTCSSDGRHAVFTTEARTFGPPGYLSEGLFVVDLKAPTLEVRRIEAPPGASLIRSIFADDVWAYVATEYGELSATPLDGSAPPRLLHSSKRQLELLTSRAP